MPRRFLESVKQGIVWLGIGVGIVVGLFFLIDRFDLSRLEIIVTLGFVGFGLLVYGQTKSLGRIESLLQAMGKTSNNPSSGQHKPGTQPKPPEKPTGSGAVGGAVIGGIIGTILAPGAGTVIGGLLGALIGNKAEYDDIQRRKRRPK